MSIFPITTNPPRRKTQRGSVALAALTALVVVLIIGLGLLTLGGNARLSGKRAMRLSGAQAMATAGIEYGYWQVTFNNQTLPYTTSRSLGNGRFSVAITDNSANIAGTMQIVSTGTQDGDSAQLTRVMQTSTQKSIYDYALASYSDFNDSGHAVTTGSGGANGDFYCNGSVTTAGHTVVNGDATVVGTASAFKSVSGATTAYATALPFPSLDTSATGYYAKNATVTYSGGQVWSNFTFPSSGAIIYVNGGVTLNGGSISGIGTIVCNGPLLINGNVSYTFSSDKMAILASGGITVNTTASIAGLYYTDNAGHNATTIINSQFTLTSGCLISDSLVFNGSSSNQIKMVHDSTLNATVYKQLHLPGY